MSEGDGPRLDRVEGEVTTIRSEMVGLKSEMGLVKADVRGLSSILTRIEQGVIRSQDQQEERETRSRHSPVAMATVLVTIMSLLVGGAWMIGSTTASTTTRLADHDTQFVQLVGVRDREIDLIDRRLDKLEEHPKPQSTTQP